MNPNQSSSAVEAPTANDNSEVAVNVKIVPNLAVIEGSEQNGDEEEHKESIEVVVKELVDPKEMKMIDTESNTQVETEDCISNDGVSPSKIANLAQ